MPMTRASIKDTTETFSRIAIAIEPGSNPSIDSVTGDWNRDPSWLWPPPLHQPYCRLHFLKECALYHLRESESSKRKIVTHTPKTSKSGKWPAAPTRVQPARRAREKNWKDQLGVPIGSRNSSPAPGDKAVNLSTTLETRRQQLQLHLPWPIYKTKIEAEIERMVRNQRENGDESRPGFQFSNELRFECRYCKFEPEVVDFKGSMPRRLAPPAPMHFIQPSVVGNGQIGEFGGIKFAVDVSAGHETIILLLMDNLQSFASHAEKGESVEESSSAKAVGSRKRSLIVESIESDEPASTTSKKRRRKRK
ncbi:hypothetical protein F4781DRAFT_357248 [Annulohypoxylon bovei var. microspora]|nr:hypothetical protein F4781DRAFT_357248 [Annulohypoxylon bovei var. microspora]